MLRALIAVVADRRGGGDAQPPFGILAGVRMQRRLLYVLHRDEADAAIILVDDQQLLDAMLMQQPARLVLVDALAHGDELLGHQLGDRLRLVVGEAHVAIGENADQPAGLLAMAALDHRNAGNAVARHQRQRVGERLVGIDGDRVDHHAALIALHLAHFRGLIGGREILVDDAETAGLRHGDGEPRLGHRVHGRGDDRQIEGDARASAAWKYRPPRA